MPLRSAAIIRRHVVAHLHRRLGHARHLLAVLLKVRQVADDKHLRQPRRIQLVIHDHASRACPSGTPSILPSGEACTPAAHSVTAASMRAAAVGPPISTQPGPTPRHLALVCTSTPSCPSVVSAFAERSSGYAASTRGPPSSSSTRLLRRIDMPEIVPHVELRNVADRAGQLHARRPAADHHKIQRRMPAVLQHLPLRQLEGQQHAPPNLGGIFNGLQPRRQLRPFVRAQNRSASLPWPAPGSRSRPARRSSAPPARLTVSMPTTSSISTCVFAWSRKMVRMGCGDIGRRQHRQRHLVEQRLESMVVAAVDDGHFHGAFANPLAA